jgi:GT2 family glycosyltransferase/glycosyltransferase involved in cell wall biosynthesis
VKLLHAVHGVPPESGGGTEQYVARIAEAQAARGHRVAILAGSLQSADPPVLSPDTSGPVLVLRYHGLPSRQHHWSEFADPIAEELVRDFLSEFRPELLHIHHWMRLTSRLAVVAADLGIPSVVTLHDTWAVCPRTFRLRGDLSFCEEPYAPTLCQTCAPRHPWQGDEEVAGLLAERYRHLTAELAAARRIIVPSEAHRRFLTAAAGLPPERLDLLPHASLGTLPAARPAGGGPPARPLRIGCFGSLVPHKGQDVLLRALPYLPPTPPWEVHLFGSPENPEFVATLQRLADGFPVHMHGPYSPDALAAADLDVAVFPALAPESFSFTLDEALQLGLPVIVTDRGALAERAGIAGLVVPAGDPDALATAIGRLLEEPGLLAQLRAASGRAPIPLESHLARLDALYAAATEQPVARAAGADEPAAQARLRHRQVLERDTLMGGLAHARRERDHALATLRLVTESRGWAFLSLLREGAQLRRPSAERARRLWRLVRRCLRRGGGLDQQYQAWLALHVPDAGQLERWRETVSRLRYRPLVSLITPVYNVAEPWLIKAIESVRAQVYGTWELCLANDASSAPHIRPILDAYGRADARIRVVHLPERQGIVGASNAALELATGEFVGFLDHDDELAPHALYAVVADLNRDPATDLVYSDEDKIDEAGRRFEPAFKPDWSPDLFRSFNYLGHLCIVRRELVRKVGGFRPGFDGSQDYDLWLRVSERTDRIAHVPDVLYSWRTLPGSAAGSITAKPYAYQAAAAALQESLDRRGIAGHVEQPAAGRYHVRYRLRATPLISVVVPMRDRAALTRRCLTSLERRTTYRPHEVVIIDNGSVEPASRRLLDDARRRHQVVRHEAPFNFSALVNRGARHATGDYLVFLNNDTEVVTPDWLQAMLEHAQRTEVGAVGAQLLYPDGRLQHAGVFIRGTPTAVAGHRFKLLGPRDLGYLGIPRSIGNVSAVTAACLMVRRAVFEAVGGFDEAFRVAFGDVDFCLRLRERGFLVVYTPLATLYHHESATRGMLHPPADDRLFRVRWRRFFEGARDPYWNPNLAVETESLGLAL